MEPKFSGPAYTVGLEEELMILDPESYALVNAIDELVEESPEGEIKLDPASHHVVHTVHLAKVNKSRGFSIIKTYPNVPPTDTMQVCDLVKNPNQATQYTPKF